MAASKSLPPPPAPLPQPLTERWRATRNILRCHEAAFAPNGFNPGEGTGGRFDPLILSSGAIIPTLYGSDTAEGAFSESIFRNVPVRPPNPDDKMVSEKHLAGRLLSTISPLRDLTLIQLYGPSLSRLRLYRREIIDCETDEYAQTRQWALALHHAVPKADGIIWVSRHNDASKAIVLFSDRVLPKDLSPIGTPLPLEFGTGLELVRDAADRAGITLVTLS